MGCYAAEFNTIAVDDGIAMGHDGMLYSLPSRDIIADSVEYMVNAHKADAMICISNCDKVTPGMLMAAMRLNIPTIFCSGRSYGGRTLERRERRPHHGHDSRRRHLGERQRPDENRADSLSWPRLLFWHVHCQLDELSH